MPRSVGNRPVFKKRVASMIDNRKERTSAFDGGRRTTPGNAGQSRILICEIAGRPFAIALQRVIEIAPVPLIAGEPAGRDTPSVIAGIINVGGTAVPLLRTSRLLDLPDCPIGLHTLVIITRADRSAGNAGPLGLMVDAVRGIVTIDAAETIDLPTHSLSTRALKSDNGVVPILDLDELLLIQERERIEELRRSHQRRLVDLQEVHA